MTYLTGNAPEKQLFYTFIRLSLWLPSIVVSMPFSLAGNALAVEHLGKKDIVDYHIYGTEGGQISREAWFMQWKD